MLPTLRLIRSKLGRIEPCEKLFDRLYRDFLHDKPAAAVPSAAPIAEPSHQPARHVGRLKRQGLKPGYGFLVSGEAPDTFIPKAAVEPALWADLLAGKSVSFEIVATDGRRRAANVRPA